MLIKLSERAMLIRFSRSAWGAKLQDKQIEKEVEQAHHATDAGTYHKTLLAKEALEKGKKAANEARTFFYSQTLPYDDEGWRIITTKNYLPFTQEEARKIAAIEEADRDFFDNYPQFIEDAKTRLNSLFNALDYPPIEELRRKFSTSVTTNPLPDSSNFPGDMQSIIDDLSADLEKRLTDIQQKAMSDLWSRLHIVVLNVATALEDPNTTFRDSLIQNIIDLCELLPRLNLTDDPNLERMKEEVKTRLTRHDPEDLRPKNAKSPTEESTRKEARKETAEEAKAILRDMEAYFTPTAN